MKIPPLGILRSVVLVCLVFLISIYANGQEPISIPAYRGEVKIDSSALPVMQDSPANFKDKIQNNIPDDKFSILNEKVAGNASQPKTYFCSTPNYRPKAQDKYDIKAVGALDCGATAAAPCYWTKPFLLIGFINGTPELKQAVREVIAEWTIWANVGFVAQDNDNYTSDTADIKIYFTPEDVYNSFVGIDAWHSSVRTGKNTPTMNLGFLNKPIRDTSKALLPWVKGTILHEFGHALGLQHEHQNPSGGIRWNREAVIGDLSGPPNNWKMETIENNIFRGLSRTRTQFTEYDASSIMHYAFPAAWTQNGAAIPENYALSETDKAFIAGKYPRKKTALDGTRYYRLFAWHGGKKNCLGISRATTAGAAGYAPFLAACDNASSGQLWKFTPLSGGEYRVTSYVMGNELSLHDGGLSSYSEMGKTGNYSAQYWNITSLGNYNRLTSSLNGNLYSLTSPLQLNSRLYMTQTGHWSNQLWEFVPAGKVQ